ncbi:MAG TPA: hypothetical protein P5560_02380 [Thermotogota bacterium]|nr:hypothetical protein [Thermotogota bacterium]HRW91776.1 hypothetical protein [Thermotogota bacterium]
MSIWESLVFGFALLSSNLLLVKRIQKWEPSGILPFFTLFLCLVSPSVYGLFQWLSRAGLQDARLFQNSIFFLNNLWLLIFFRNSIVSYNEELSIGKYFVSSVLLFLVPVCLGIFFMPNRDFFELIAQVSYVLGLFPMLIFVAMLVGISVDSTPWGVILSCFLFSIDFFLRLGFFDIVPSPFPLVFSEGIRTLLIFLALFLSHFGTPVPRKESPELFSGTRKMNNVFFLLLATFPVLIFNTTFWQMNVNFRETQKREIQLAKDVFSVTLKMLENSSEKYFRVVQDAQNSSNITSAQWKLKTFSFTDPEVQAAQIITSFPLESDQVRVLFENGTIQFLSRNEQGWGIKVQISGERLYRQLPLNAGQSLFVFENQLPVLYPGNVPPSDRSFLNLGKYAFAFKNEMTLFGHPIEAFLVFETSPPVLGTISLSFLVSSVVILVLIWSFYGFYISNWEKEARKRLMELSRAKQEVDSQKNRLQTSVKVLSADLKLSEKKAAQYLLAFQESLSMMNHFSFEGEKSMELVSLLDRFVKASEWLQNLWLVEKRNDTFLPVSASAHSGQVPTPMEPFSTSWKDQEIPAIAGQTKVSLWSFGEKDTFMWMQPREGVYLPKKGEREWIDSFFHLFTFYIHVSRSSQTNDWISSRYMNITQLVMELSGQEQPTMEVRGETILRFCRKVFNDVSHLGILQTDLPGGNSRHFFSPSAKGQLVQESLAPDAKRASAYLPALLVGKPLFLTEMENGSALYRTSHSAMLLPLPSTENHAYALLMEYDPYKFFTNPEKECAFFLVKVLSQLFPTGIWGGPK